MKQVGGKNVKDYVYRVLNNIIHPSIQPQINTLGSHGKAKFPAELTKLIFGEFFITD